ncbi:MAG: PAS domain S-box protein, partial [Pseudomonadota bacterium]
MQFQPLEHLTQAPVAQPRSIGIPLAVAAFLTLLVCLALLAGWRSGTAFLTVLVFSAATAVLALLHASREASQRHASGDALLAAAARLSGLLDSAMDAIITVDEQHRIVLYNRTAEKIFGWAPAQALGAKLEMLMPQRFRSGHGAHIRHFSATGTTTRRMGDGTVLYGVRVTGEEFPMEGSISQLDTAEGKLFTVILRDVTERVRAQEELSAFAMQAHAIRESEKTRIARELHDELAQSLTALKMDTIWVLDKLPEGADA